MPTPQIPDHNLIRCIGRGAYGEVWLARNVLGILRAVKIVYRSSFDHDRPYEREFNGIQRFEPVSRSHEGFVDILQVGRNEAEQYFYYVMELGDDEQNGQKIDPGSYEPKTLRTVLRGQQPLLFDEALAMGLSLCHALAKLHENDLIHRDIKPSNIIFVNGVPKLADIGLVTAVGSDTIRGGTVGYMAPEWVPSPQSDIYSLGMVLYEMTTGKDRLEYPEWPSDTGTTSSSRLPEVQEVISKACAIDADQRYSTATDLANDLVKLQLGKSVKRVRMLERRLALLTRVGVVAVAVGLIAAFGFYQVSRENKRTRHRLAQSYIGIATRSVDSGDLFGALPWYTEALRLIEGEQPAERDLRIRMGTVMMQSPRILQMWFRSAGVNEAQFSPDGERLVVAGDEGAATILEIASGEEVLRLPHPGAVLSASFSEDGQLIVTASGNLAMVWDAQTGGELASLGPHKGLVWSARFDSKAERVITACADRKARVWFWRSNSVPWQTLQHHGTIESALFSPDGRFAVTGSHDNTARIWRLDETEPSFSSLPHPNWVYDVAISPSGEQVATACYQNIAQLWNLSSGTLVRDLPHDAGVRSIAFSPDSQYVVTTCWDIHTRIWSCRNGQLAGPLLKHSDSVVGASFSPEGRRIATVTTHGVVTVWDFAPATGVPPSIFEYFSPDGSAMARLLSNQVEVVRVPSGTPIGSRIRLEHPEKLVLSPRGDRFLAIETSKAGGQTNKTAVVFDVASGNRASLPLAWSARHHAVFDRAGQTLAIFADKTVQIWDVIKSQYVSAPLTNRSTLRGVEFSADSTKLLARGVNAAYVWDIPSGQLTCELRRHGDLSHAEFSPDGRWVATAHWDTGGAEYDGQILDASTGEKICPPLRHRDGVLYISFSPDGRRVVTAGEDSTAQVWDCITGERLGPPLRHKHQVYQAVFSPDGRWILTVSRDQTARVWDSYNEGHPITPPLRHPWGVSSGRFVADGQQILTARGDDMRLWNLVEDSRPVEDLISMSRLLSGHKSSPTGGAVPLETKALRELWNSLSFKFPKAFASAANETLSWHEREAARAEAARNWRAARFHLERLLPHHTNDTRLQARHAQVLNQIQK